MTDVDVAPAPTSTGGPAGLKALKPRHKLIALMCASGRTNAQIASELGMSSVGISTILKSPLMRALVAQYLQQIESKTSTSVADVIATLRGETSKTLTTILSIRDEGTKEDSVRLAAAIELFDRQIPKVHKTDESRTVRIVLDGDRLERLRAITVESKALPPAAATDADLIPAPAGARSNDVADLNEMIERYRALESQEAVE